MVLGVKHVRGPRWSSRVPLPAPSASLPGPTARYCPSGSRRHRRRAWVPHGASGARGVAGVMGVPVSSSPPAPRQGRRRAERGHHHHGHRHHNHRRHRHHERHPCVRVARVGLGFIIHGRGAVGLTAVGLTVVGAGRATRPASVETENPSAGVSNMEQCQTNPGTQRDPSTAPSRPTCRVASKLRGKTNPWT